MSRDILESIFVMMAFAWALGVLLFFCCQDSFLFLFFKAFSDVFQSSPPGCCRMLAVCSDLLSIVIFFLDSSVLYLQCFELFATTWMGSAQVAQPLHLY